MLKRFLPFLLLLISSAALHAQVALSIDTAHFVINQGNHPVGRTDFSIQPIKQGNISTPGAYSVNSHGTLTLQKTSYSFSNSGSLDGNLGILEEDLNGIVNGAAVNFSVRPNGGAFAVNISANGTNSHSSLNRVGQTVFFPDFDLASYDILLNLRAHNPGAPISALIPKQSGFILPATIAAQVDVQGTLSGRAIAVHHVSLTIGSVTSELYYSTSNRILEVDIPSQTFAIVHDNFQLKAPPPPPPNTAQPNQQPAGSAPQQNQ
jgi:hypothetical protein